jgi:hypothetical protein
LTRLIIELLIEAVSWSARCSGIFQARGTWRHVETKLKKAAAEVDARQVSIALKTALMLENAECRPARPIDRL